ncbi:MAG TPA: dienelactone hydrolase family protein [Pseudonocardiaceae bacterium]|jgi:predicted dienelactone hydrolase|nr:dienelactone hydrolase family protein [Pseudonocardiaceae bacterium]
MYDPFDKGPLPVGVTTRAVHDPARDCVFPCEVWYPAVAEERDAAAVPGTYPLVVFSHPSGGHRRSATFLCSHLSGHGYVVAALDHWEVVADRAPATTDEQLAARIDALIANRVPDIRLLLDELLDGDLWRSADLDPGRVGIVGHSFGGWTALATPDVEPRVKAVVALAPGGSAKPLPGMIPATLDFHWSDRDVPTLYLAADRDTSTPLDGIEELFSRTPAPRRMVVLRRADHLHFMDDVEQVHEATRAMTFDGDAAWIPKAMPPMTELCSGDQAHLFTRGLTLAHFDSVLMGEPAAERLLAGDIQAELAARGVD